MVGADAGDGAVLDGINEGGHVLRLADGRVDLVLQAAVVKPEVVRGDLAADPRAAQAAHPDGIDRFLGGNVAHMQPGAVVFGKVAVAHSFDVFGKAVIPGADLAVLGVGHHGQTAVGGNGKDPRHNGVVHHAVAVLGDEFDILGQGEQVVDAYAVEVLGDGHRLVGVAQSDAGCLGFDRAGDLGAGADRLCVGHQVHKGVPARRSGGGAGGDILFIFKAGGAPVAVGVDKSRQQRASLGVQHVLALRCGQPQTERGDLTVLQPDFQRLTVTVLCIADQHNLLLLAGFTKKDFSRKREKSKRNTSCSAQRKERPTVDFMTDGKQRHSGTPLVHSFLYCTTLQGWLSMKVAPCRVRDFTEIFPNFWTF